MGALKILVFPSMVVIMFMMLINFLHYAWMARTVKLGWCCAWARLRSWRRARHDDPEVQAQIAKLTAEFRVYCGRRVMACFRICMMVLGGTVLVQGFIDERVEEARVVAAAGAIVVVSVAGVFPNRCIAEGSLPWMHVLIMANVCFLAAAADGKYFSPVDPITSTMLSFLCAGVYLSFPLFLVTSTCHFACTLLSRVYLSPPSDQPYGFIPFEVLVWVSRMTTVYCVEALIEFSAKKEVEARFGQCQRSAVSSLLDLMCDAVVDLDAELLMKSHFPKLANMLVHGKGKTLCGQALSSLLGEGEDQRVFMAAARGAQAQGQGSPGMFTVRLRDSMSNLVKVILYHVPYRSVGGSTHHLLGVREDVDAWSTANPAGEAVLRPDIAMELLAGATMQEGAPAASINVCSRRGGGSVSSRRSSKASSRTSQARQYGEWLEPENDMAMRIGVEEGLPVWSMGAALQAQLGISGRAPVDLVEFLADDGKELSLWLMKAVNDVDNRNKSQCFTLRFGELTLSSDREGAGDAVKGMAFVCFERPLPDDEDETEYVIIGLSPGLRRPLPLGRGTSATAQPQPLGPGGDPSRHISL